MSSVFNDFLHQTISASTILAGTCHLLQKIPQVPQIPEIEKMKRIALGIGFTAVATRAFMSCNEKRKKLVVGIRLAAIASTIHYAYNLIPKSPVKTPTQHPAMVQLARVAAIAITIHTLYKLVRKSPVTPPLPPPAPTPPTPPPPPAVTPPRITQGTRTGLYTERSTEEIANLALISMLRQNMQTSAEIDQWIQQSAANAAPAPVLGANLITRLTPIPTPQNAGTNTFDFTQALQATLAKVRATGSAQGGLFRINGLYRCIVVAPSVNAGHFVYRYFNPIASFHATNAGIMEMGDPQQFISFLNKQAQPFWATDPPNTVCECIPCTVPP